MKILALESSAKAASCAVLADGVPVASAWQCTGLTHSRTLLPMVEDMLHSSDLTLQDLDAVAVAAGPGSFTGLRIGISAVKGLAWAADKPCMGVSTLEAMAWPLAHLEGVLFCAMDARRQQIYNAVFRGGDGPSACGRTGPSPWRPPLPTWRRWRALSPWWGTAPSCAGRTSRPGASPAGWRRSTCGSRAP